MDFAGKVVLVTGASTGVGRATALQFAERGAQLALVAWDRDDAEMRAAGELCARACGHRPQLLHVDLATDEGCERIAMEILDRFGRLDVLVNNAGVGARSSLENADMVTFDRVFAVNVRAVYNLTRLLLPALLAAKGNVVNVSSVSADSAVLGLLPYAMSKAALNHFTRLTALELAPKGVRVNAVAPGLVESTFVRRLTGMSDADYATWLSDMESKIPLGGRACAGADIARHILHLASDVSKHVTGVILPVDGAMGFVSSAFSVVSDAKKN